VTKVAIKLLLEVEVVERVHKVLLIEVGVDAEHLEEDGLADAGKLLRESAPLTHPLIRAAEEGRVGDVGVVGEGDAGGVG